MLFFSPGVFRVAVQLQAQVDSNPHQSRCLEFDSPLVDVTDNIRFDVMPLFCKFRAKICLQEQDSHEEQPKNHGGEEDTLSDNALKNVFRTGIHASHSPWLLLEGSRDQRDECRLFS